MPSQQDRVALTERVRSLMASLKHHDRKEIAALILDMLVSYEVAQSKQLTAAERKANVTVYVRELNGVPTWAVAEACNRIRLGLAPDISHQYKPTPIQVRVLAVSIAQPWKQEALKIGEILGAQEYHEGPSEEERGRLAIKWRALAEALKERTLNDTGLANALAEIERERREALLRRHAEVSADAIRREWASVGEKPPEGELLISRSLVKKIEAQKKAPAPDEAQEPMVL
jgi:hypothetical protein